MAVLLLLMALENANNNGGISSARPIFGNRPAIVQRGDRPLLRRLARPFQRNR